MKSDYYKKYTKEFLKNIIHEKNEAEKKQREQDIMDEATNFFDSEEVWKKIKNAAECRMESVDFYFEDSAVPKLIAGLFEEHTALSHEVLGMDLDEDSDDYDDYCDYNYILRISWK